MIVDFQFGDIIQNGYASHDNPTRVGVFIRYVSNPRGSINAGRFIECRSDNGSFWKTDVGNDRLTKIGSIFDPAEARLAQAEGGPAVTEAMAKLNDALCEFTNAASDAYDPAAWIPETKRNFAALCDAYENAYKAGCFPKAAFHPQSAAGEDGK